MSKTINTRIKQKHATEQEWLESTLVPLAGEVIVYDATDTTPAQLKIGDGISAVSALQFLVTYATKLDIENLFGGSTITTTSLLGTATLGQMILGE